MTIELLDTEETQTEDPMEVQVILTSFPSLKDELDPMFLRKCMGQNVPRRAERDVLHQTSCMGEESDLLSYLSPPAFD